MMKSGSYKSAFGVMNHKRSIALILIVLVFSSLAVFLLMDPAEPDPSEEKTMVPESLENPLDKNQKREFRNEIIPPALKPPPKMPLHQKYPKGFLQDAPDSNPWNEEDMGC